MGNREIKYLRSFLLLLCVIAVQLIMVRLSIVLMYLVYSFFVFACFLGLGIHYWG